MAKNKDIGRDRKRQTAFDLYINTDMTQKDICEIVGWTEKTFSENKKKGNWDEIKGAETATLPKTISNIYRLINTLTEADNSGSNADKISKLSASVRSLSKGTLSLSDFINAFKELTTFAFKIDPDLAKEMNLMHNQFIQHKANGAK